MHAAVTGFDKEEERTAESCFQFSENKLSFRKNALSLQPVQIQVITYERQSMAQSMITVAPMLVCAFWMAMLALDVKEHGDRAAHRALLLWAAAATLLYMGHCVFFNRDTLLLPLFDTLYVVCNLAVFPLYLRYLVRLTEGRVSRSTNLLVAVPPVAFGVVVGALYLLMTPLETAHFIEAYLYRNSFDSLAGLVWWMAVVHHAGKVLFAVGVVVTLWVGTRKVRRYNRLVDSLYADTDNRRLRGVTTILVLMVATCIVSFTANAIGRHYFAGRLWLLAIPFVMFSMLLFALGYCGYRQQFSFEDVELGTDGPEAAPEAESMGQWLAQVRGVMSDEQLYLLPDLKVDDVARRLGTNRRYVQQAMNEELGMTFSEYVNRLRVDYAERVLQQEPGITVEELGQRAGYATKSTFYRNFARFKGYRPKAAER